MLKEKLVSVEKDNNSENNHLNALTGIRNSYTLSATESEEFSEVDNLMIRHFLEILAEVAFSVASGKKGEYRE